MTRSSRKHPRYAHEAAIAFHVGDTVITGRTLNVSRGGLCADLVEPIPTGTDLMVDLQLVFEDEQHSEPLRIAARVVWCTPVDEAHQVGIVFRQLHPELAEYLTMFLRYLVGGTPYDHAPRPATIDELFG